MSHEKESNGNLHNEESVTAITNLISRYKALSSERDQLKIDIVTELTRIRDSRIYLLRDFDSMKAFEASLSLPFSLSTYKSIRLEMQKKQEAIEVKDEN